MIEGLLCEVKADELKTLLLEQAEYHKKRVLYWGEQAEKIKANKPIEDNADEEDDSLSSLRSYSNSIGMSQEELYKEQIKKIEERVKENSRKAKKLTFIAEHLNESETYRLNDGHLRELGVIW